jgi:hypothetical protein
MTTHAPILVEGWSFNDDGTIRADKESSVCNTLFADSAFEVRCTTTINGMAPIDREWIEFLITEVGKKRLKRSSFCLRKVEQIRRLRDMCNITLGETS